MRSRDANDILREDGPDDLRRAIDEHRCAEACSLIENHRVLARWFEAYCHTKASRLWAGQSGRRRDFRISGSRRFAVDENFIFRPRGAKPSTKAPARRLVRRQTRFKFNRP
jgi:hypothetical protein